MPQRSWRAQKKPPQTREPEKEPKKKTLQEHCRELSTNLAEARKAKLAAEKRARDRVAEDELMAMIHGPMWNEDEAQKKAS